VPPAQTTAATGGIAAYCGVSSALILRSLRRLARYSSRPAQRRPVENDEYCALVRQGLAQYGMTIADLADQQPRARSKEDIVFERVGVQERASASLAKLTRVQIRRFADNTLRAALIVRVRERGHRPADEFEEGERLAPRLPRRSGSVVRYSLRPARAEFRTSSRSDRTSAAKYVPLFTQKR
jgi:hypothetical protein